MTSHRRHVPTRFLINQCQIITFLILKTDNIENSRIELKGIILPVPSNQNKATFIIILPINLGHMWFFPVSRFRILRGGGGQRGSRFPAGTWRRTDVDARYNVASTSFRRHVPIRFLINQCQIITFLILKSDNIENSRIELKGIVLPVPSNQIKVTFIIILPINLGHLWFFPVSKFRILRGGGGGNGGPDSQQEHDVILTSMRATTSHRRHFDAMCPFSF